MQIETMHYATWQYLFKENVLFTDYASRVPELVELKVKEIIKSNPKVYESTGFCCQAEGFQIQSDSIADLMEAANEIDRYMKRFVHIVIL